MPDLSEVYRKPPDLTRYTESTRREPYDRLVAIQFTTRTLPPSSTRRTCLRPTSPTAPG